MAARIDKGGIAVCHPAALYLYGANFGNFAGYDRKTGGFNIENHYLIAEKSVPLANKRTYTVVDKIRFQPVYDLHVRFFGGYHSLRKALNIGMIGNGYRLVSPPLCGVYRLGGGNDRIHCRHGCMQMQLNSLFLCRVEPWETLDLCN